MTKKDFIKTAETFKGLKPSHPVLLATIIYQNEQAVRKAQEKASKKEEKEFEEICRKDTKKWEKR